MQNLILFIIASFFSCAVYSMETTKQELTNFDINRLQDDQLGDILSQQLEKDDLIPSIRRLWQQREVDKRYETLITPRNIVLWIKKRDIGIASLPAIPGSPAQFVDLTPLMQALHLNDMNVAKILLDGGAVNEKNSNGSTALIYPKQDINHMKLLLNTPGININIQNNQGATALSMAALAGRTDVVELLLAYCPNIHLKLYNNYLNEHLRGKSILDWAKEAKAKEAYLIRGYEIGHKNCDKCKQYKK